MATALTVTQEFGKYKRGDRITDPKEVAEVRATRNRHYTVAVTLPDPEPEPRAHAAEVAAAPLKS